MSTRLGILIPPANIRCEIEFPPALPAGYSAHFTRLLRPQAHLTAQSLSAMKASALDAADRLRAIEPAVLAYACTSGSFLDGAQAHEDIAQQLQRHTGIAALTTASAVLRALHALAARRVGFVTPYPEAITASAVRLLTEHGIAVAAISSYNYSLSVQIMAISPESLAERVTALCAAQAADAPLDAIFISCTNVATFPVIEALEQDLGLPVVSSNSATLCLALRWAGYSDRIAGLGRLGTL